MVVTAISGIETLRQLSLLGKANFKAAKSLTAWKYLQQVKATAKTLMNVVVVEKSVFSIWVDLLLCRSIQLLVLSYAEMFVYMYLSQLMSTFTNYLKVHHLLDGFFNSMTRRTSDSTITHMYLYTHVSQI